MDTIQATPSEGAESVTDRLEALFARNEAGDSQEPATPYEGAGSEETPAKADGTEGQSDDDAGDTPDGTEDSTDSDADQLEVDADVLAAALGLDAGSFSVADDGKLTFTTKVDGQESQTTLQDLIKSYQLEGHVNKRSMELAEQRKALESEAATMRGQLSSQIKQANVVVGLFAENLKSQHDSIDWKTLRVSNPAEYAALQADFQQRYHELHQLHENVAAMTKQQEAEDAAKAEEEHNAFVLKEFKALVDTIPAWRDPAVSKAESLEIMDFLKTRGFSDAEVSKLVDHRHILLVRDALAYQKAAKNSQEVVEKLKDKTTKILLKPGSRNTNADKRTQSRQEQRAKVRKAGGTVDAVASALLDRM